MDNKDLMKLFSELFTEEELRIIELVNSDKNYDEAFDELMEGEKKNG